MSQQHYSHSMRRGREEKLVGAFVVVALLILVAVFVMNSRNLYLFEQTIAIELEADSAQGIGRDTPIRAAGMQIGRVVGVELTDEHRFLIHGRIYERYMGLLRSDSTASIGSLSMLGRSSIEMTVGSPQLAPLDTSQRIGLHSGVSVDELMAMAKPMVDNVNQVLVQTNALLHSIEPSQVQQTMQHAEQLLGELHDLMAQVQRDGTLVHWLINDTELTGQIDANLRAMETLVQASTARLEHIDDAMPRVYNTLDAVQLATVQSAQIMDEVPAMLLELRELTEQSQQLMDQVSRSWPLSRSRQPQQPRELEGSRID